MTILIHGTTVITADDADSVLYDAAIALEGGRIAAIGPSAALRARFPAAEAIDGRDRAVLPGFANIHTHLGMTLARGVFEDLSPPHKPPFCGGLSPIPLPAAFGGGEYGDVPARRAGGDPQRHHGATGGRRRPGPPCRRDWRRPGCASC